MLEIGQQSGDGLCWACGGTYDAGGVCGLEESFGGEVVAWHDVVAGVTKELVWCGGCWSADRWWGVVWKPLCLLVVIVFAADVVVD